MSRYRFASCGGLMVVLVLLVSGCVPTLGQELQREPRTSVPPAFGTEPEGASADDSSARLDWNEFFADPLLGTLIETALQNNQELNIQLQEVLIAQNEIMARTGEYLPRVDATAGVGFEKVGEHTSQGVSDDRHGVAEYLRDYRLGFVASWEVDVWKRLRNAAKSATYRWLASEQGRNFMVTRLVAEIASSYYELMALDRQLEVLRSNIDLQVRALEIVRLEKQAARVTELAVQRFEAEVLRNRSRQYDLEQAILATENRINLLVGRFPQPIDRQVLALDDPLPDMIRSGVPSQLLENRPDVRRAELELAAADLDVQVAKARFYPSLSIDGVVGYEAFEGGHLFTTPESLLVGAGGRLVAPLLNRRSLKAEYLSSGSERLVAVLDYEQTVLRAFMEVRDQLALIGNLERSYALEARQVATLSRAIDVSTRLFRSAQADYMEVLLTRRDALDAQMELIETRLRQKQALVSVYQALGGGWRGASSDAEEEAPAP